MHCNAVRRVGKAVPCHALSTGYDKHLRYIKREQNERQIIIKKKRTDKTRQEKKRNKDKT